MSTTLQDRATSVPAQLGIIDCDIHPAQRTPTEIMDYLPARWREHAKTYGYRSRQPFIGALPYPRMTPGTGQRADAWPPGGAPPGSDLAFMQAQHLHPNNVEFGVLQPLSPNASNLLDQDFGAALATAVNDWQLDRFTKQDPRLKASLVVTHDWPDAAIAEIERRAGDANFVQIAIPPRTMEPIGRRRYWPIFEAAQRHNLPIGMHVYAVSPHAFSASGWPSYYIEEHHLNVHSMQAVVTSLVMEGVFERFPGLKFVLIEGGFAWAPALAWRLDHAWRRLRSELPHVKRPPSDYIREHIWFTTQPIEEPERRDDMLATIEWLGWDRLMFSTDYPHWDFDDPKYAFKVQLTPSQRRAIFHDNAASLYGLR
jgi:predicted TIM-barrel fold metal-dependent hydrolase